MGEHPFFNPYNFLIMSCAITEDYVIDCNKDSVGGLSKMRVASRNDIVSYTETAGKITAITMKTGSRFYDVQLVKSTSTYSNTLTANPQAGTFFYAQSATLILNKIKAATTAFVESLAKSSLVMIVLDKNGEVVLLGRENGLDLNGGTAGAGTASGDRNGYELQFAGEEIKLSHVDPTIIDDLLLPAP
jgi:hypothetical protein